MKRKRDSLILLLAALALPLSGHAQETTWSYRTSSGGWIGISVEFTLTSMAGEEQTQGEITEVVEGSPADSAGILVGDLITHLNGRPVTQKSFTSLPNALEPGDMVRLVIVREGETRDVFIEAAERPRTQIIISRPNTQEMIIRLDTVRGAILKSLDSLRGSIASLHLDETSGRLSVEVHRELLRSDTVSREMEMLFRFNEPFVQTLTLEPEAFLMTAPEFAVPFEAFLFRTRATDSLEKALSRVKAELNQVLRQERSRERAIRASIQGPVEQALRQDEALQEFRVQAATLAQEQENLRVKVSKVREEEKQRQWAETRLRQDEEGSRAWRNLDDIQRERAREQQQMELQMLQEFEALRSRDRAPVLLGENWIMGAQILPLNGEWARRLSVDEGVVVWEVLADTPAAEWGFQAGDVIVRVAGENVVTLQDLRRSLGTLEGQLRIHLVREGEPREIIIRR